MRENNVARETLIEKAMHAIRIASIKTKLLNVKSGSFGTGKPFGIFFTIEMLKFLLKFKKYEETVIIITLKVRFINYNLSQNIQLP